jgi:hypothetical protein
VSKSYLADGLKDSIDVVVEVPSNGFLVQNTQSKQRK